MVGKEEEGWGMSSISPSSFSRALRLAYPCLPRLLLPRGSLVARGGTDDVAMDFVAAAVDSCRQAPPKKRTPLLFVPLLRPACYRCGEETRELLSDFARRHGYVSPLFLPCRSFLPQHTNGKDDGGSAGDTQTPTVSVRLVRCEQRVNLADCMRTRLLQEELRRTEAELWHLYKHAHSCLLVSGGDVAQLGDALPFNAVTGTTPLSSDQLCLVWHRHGWYFEDPALAVEQSKCTPCSSRSVGFWRAWLPPLTTLFKGFYPTNLRDIHQFFVEHHVRFINQEALYRYLAEGRGVVFPRRGVCDAADYWASSGELLRPDNTSQRPADAEKEETDVCSRFRPDDSCWFALAELPARRLRIRRGGEVFQQPVRYDGCGFFLHLAPRWFLLSQEELMRCHPLSFATVRNISLASELGSVPDFMVTTESINSQCGEFVFLLQDTATWHMYPLRHGVVNFCHRLSDAPDLRCAHGGSSPATAAPLIFVDINVALRLMRDWSSRQQPISSVGNMPPPGGRERIIMFFNSLPSTLSTASFVTAFIEQCADTVECASPPPPEECPTPARGGAVPEETRGDKVVVAARAVRAEAETGREKTAQLLYDAPCCDESANSHHNFEVGADNHVDDVDFPAVDRRVYTPGHRLSRAYTHPRDEKKRQDCLPRQSNLATAVAEGIVNTTRRKKHNVLSWLTEDTAGPKSPGAERDQNSVRDVGVVWISFDYSVPAVNACDTEIMP